MENPLVTGDVCLLPEVALPIQTSSQLLVEAIESADAESHIILDFDETLFLRNSTESYLDAIYPRPIGAAFLALAKAAKPWRWFPSRFRDESISKDWFLVVSATVLFPWTTLVWQYRAKTLAEKYYNKKLINAIENNPQAQIAIATLGFNSIVRPLIKHLPISSNIETLDARVRLRTIACRFWQGAIDRANGKHGMVIEALGEAAVAKAIVVTDSLQDMPLLRAASKPFLFVWPEAMYLPAMVDVYVPLLYSEKIKNPGKSHILKRVISGHWAFLSIALSFLSPHPLVNSLGLLLLTLSYWCVYEIGYQENDRAGEKYESQPILSENYSQRSLPINLTKAIAPWCAALGFASGGIVLVELSKCELPIGQSAIALGESWDGLLQSSALWIGLLLAVRLSFWIYNQFNEEARIWIYPVLQVQKLFGFTLLLGTNAVGAMLLLSLAVSRWLHYSIYRCGGDRWQFPINLSSLVLFNLMLFAVAIGLPDPLSLVTWQTGFALVYCLVRSMKGIYHLRSRLSLLKNSPKEKVANLES